MITKTFICDKCKKSVGETDLRQISVKITKSGVPSYDRLNISVDKDVCIDCLKKANIVTEMTPEEKEKKGAEIQAKNVKTVEDKLLELLEDLGVAFAE